MAENNPSVNNKRIAKNTLALYFRMLFSMLVSLYTSRVFLNALGVEDYGINNVVGGLIGMFSILSGSLTAAISRFITYELGKGNTKQLRKVFSSAINIQLALGFIVILLAETIGLWFLNTEMNIPSNRMPAANWVFQFSLVSFFLGIITIPYNAVIIAHERITTFAYIGIFEVLAKLGIAILIVHSPIDRLIFVSLLTCVIAVIVRLTYGIYCKLHFQECKYQRIWDKNLLKQMFSFAGWNFIGASSAILRDQGGNILINLFCGPVANAARGVAYQVNIAVQSFANNFMTAINPQITKSYACGNQDYMMTLIFQGARLSFYMLLILSLPVIINTSYILELWLKTVPEFTSLFVKLILIFTMSESISNPLVTAMLATGNIRKYQIIVGGLQMLNFPLSFLLLKQGFKPEIIFIVAIFISQCCLIARLILLRKMIKLNAKEYFKKVYLNVISVSLIAILIPTIIQPYFTNNFTNFIYSCIICVISTITTIYYIGCNRKERHLIYLKLYQITHKIIKHD